jgi:aryl-alcohol dehydrogenase-like predicted oxidoreductase
MVSTLSLGGMFDILNNRLMLAKALERGINYWDTAEGYGGGRRGLAGRPSLLIPEK